MKKYRFFNYPKLIYRILSFKNEPIETPNALKPSGPIELPL